MLANYCMCVYVGGGGGGGMCVWVGYVCVCLCIFVSAYMRVPAHTAVLFFSHTPCCLVCACVCGCLSVCSYPDRTKSSMPAVPVLIYLANRRAGQHAHKPGSCCHREHTRTASRKCKQWIS